MADGTVTIPGGLKLKKNVAIGIGVAAVGVGGYYYYRKRQADAAAAQNTSAQGQALSDQNIDPATGYAYGSPEDQAALAAMQGAGGNPLYGGGGYYLGGPPTTGTNPTPQGFQSNAQWTQAAEQYMGSTGADAIAAALGKYLLASPLTADQVTIVQQAIAAEGFPPVAGTNGFPPSYKTVESPPPHQGAGGPKNPVKGLKATARSTQVDVSWDALAKAKSYTVEAHKAGSAPGTKIEAREQTSGTHITLHNLKEKTRYRVSVLATGGSGPAASTTVTTH